MSASVIPQTASDAWSWNQRWRARLPPDSDFQFDFSDTSVPGVLSYHLSSLTADTHTHKVPTQPRLTNSAVFFLSLITFVLFGHFCTSWPSGRLSKKFTSSRSSVVPCCPRHMGNRIKNIPINLPLARHLLQFFLGNGEVFPRQLRSIIWSPPSQMYPKVPYQLPEDIPVRCL